MAEISYADKVQDVSVLHTSKRIIGVPMTMVVMLSMMGLGMFAVVKWWVGLLTFFVPMVILYQLYANDPHAVHVIRTRVMSRFVRASGGRKPKRQFKSF